jgi:ribosomal protein L16 Arg81 hydroxylase
MIERLLNETQGSMLDTLIGPVVSSTEFLASYYEKQPLLSQPGDPERYSSLISIDQIDDMLSSTELPARALQMARKEPPVYREDFSFEDGVIDRTGVLNEYQNGATVILPQLQHRHPVLKQFCMALEAELSCHVQTNIYLTPPNNQGFASHYDNHDVFVLQVSGKKRWRIYEKPLSNPYRGEAFNRACHKPGEIEQEFILEPGQCAYIPRGWMHDAESLNDEASLHITVGLITKTWADLMLESLSEFALRDEAFRESLPAGFAREDLVSHPALIEAMKTQFSDLVARFAAQANFDDTFELFLQNFLSTRDTTTRHSLKSAFLPASPNDLFRRRQLTQCAIRDEGENLLLVCAAGDLRFDKKLETGLDQMMSGEKFSRQAFTGQHDVQACNRALDQLLAGGVIERV